MNLNYELNDASKKLIDEYGENPVYCIPYDISREGNMVDKSFAVATSESIFIIQDEKIISKYVLSECENIVCESMVHCGLLSAKIKGDDYILCRFTNAWITQFSYFAQGAIRLKRNINERVISHEAEKICPVCKRALPKTKECVKCNARGRFTKRILNMASPFKYRFIFLTLAAVLSTLIVLSIRFVERDFIDNFLIPVRGELNEILKFFSLILIMNATVLGLSIIINRSGAALGTRISKNLRRMIYNKLQKSSLEFIHDRNPGELLNRIHQDTSAIRRFFQMGFSRIFSTFLSMVGALVIMGIMDFKITLAAMAMIPVILIISASFRKKIKRIFSAQWKFEDRANNQVADAVSGIRVIKAFGKEKQQIGEFIDINSKLADRQSKNEKFWAAFHPMLGLTLGLTSMIVILMSGLNVINGNFTIGQMGQFIAYTGILIGPLTWMSMLPRLFYHTLTSIERIYDVLEDDRVLYKSDNPVEKEILGDVEFKDVSFGYKVYEKVLDDISFKVGKGEMIGIVGYSGAGKSTLINLLIRLYDPDSGEITVDGFNIKNYEPANYHTQIGIVLQETFLFSGSILDNIKYSVPEATYDDVIKASKIANAHDFIVKFIDGYNTKVGEKGVNLSGGERQRIAIARAILGDPKIMVLDEATSSLDSETEFLIQEAVARLTKGRTTFVIAHRLSTLRKSDRIIVIDNNKIAEIGSHKELIRKGGIYYNLVKAQLEMNKI